MNIKKLALALPLALLVASCNRNDYTIPKCTSPSTQSKTVLNPIYYSDSKHWDILRYDYVNHQVHMRYTGDAFTDICVDEMTGMEASITGAFTDVTAFVHPDPVDSFQIPLNKTTSGSTSTWAGANDKIDLRPFYQNYPGKVRVVVYITLPYPYLYNDAETAFLEMRKAFGSMYFKLLGKRY